jgi:ferric-dicitrate binding protein FerR (iron transport regulator)
MDKTQMPEEQINTLIISFLTNDISEEQLALLQQWIGSDRTHAEYFNRYAESWMIAGYPDDQSAYDASSSWERMKVKMKNTNEPVTLGTTRKFILKYAKLAASWLVFFLLGIGTLQLIRRPVEILPRPVVLEVPLGAKSSIILPDGSKVWLNAGTKLTYDENYGKKTRLLVLSGEAYFDVAHDRKHPFIVSTSGLKIQALGTKFNVKAYPEEPSVMTTLEEGKIDIQIMSNRKGAKDIILMPNEKFVYQKSSGSFERSSKNANQNITASKTARKTPSLGIIEKHVNTELYTSWKDKRWIIEGETLDKLAPMLERKYNVKIACRDDILKYYSFTGTIEKETIEQIMNAIKLTAPIDFELKKDSVILTADRNMQDQFKQITKPEAH